VPEKPPKWIVLFRNSQAVKDFEQASKSAEAATVLSSAIGFELACKVVPGIILLPGPGY
jgi:hypothetical protein